MSATAIAFRSIGDRIDTELHARIGDSGIRALKRGLAALMEIGRQERTSP
jgi:hypothetical protein